MKILIVGAGGREHALAWKCAQTADEVIVAPGNAGTAREDKVRNAPVSSDDIDALIELARTQKVSLTIVGPEAPLAAGISDRLREAGFLVFGPSAAAARLEASKRFTKEICDAADAPTAAWARFSDAGAAKDYVRAQGAPIVIKADGLAAGKGVIVAMTLDEALAAAETVAPITADVTQILQDLADDGQSILFEGAQGTFLDIDHGTYPFVTSSNTIAGAAAVGTGLGPRDIHRVLGIVKAYTTRVGSGPFPTELLDDVGRYLAARGQEFGATTGRARRTGWFDAAALKRSIQLNGVSGLCITKLDVLDGFEEIRICTAYRLDGELLDAPPLDVQEWARLEPVYESFPGWQESSRGARRMEDLPANARSYLAAMEALCGAPVHIVSTGPDRNENIVIRYPFDL